LGFHITIETFYVDLVMHCNLVKVRAKLGRVHKPKAIFFSARYSTLCSPIIYPSSTCPRLKRRILNGTASETVETYMSSSTHRAIVHILAEHGVPSPASRRSGILVFPFCGCRERAPARHFRTDASFILSLSIWSILSARPPHHAATAALLRGSFCLT